jgi:hypothetical protein
MKKVIGCHVLRHLWYITLQLFSSGTNDTWIGKCVWKVAVEALYVIIIKNNDDNNYRPNNNYHRHNH